MSSLRLHARIASARFVSTATLYGHQLRFHKKGRDGSGKCDIHHTGEEGHCVIGVVYDLRRKDMAVLDRIEGLEHGYQAKIVPLSDSSGSMIEAYTYYATDIDAGLRPFHWYKQHVLIGAREFNLPHDYIQQIAGVKPIVDPDDQRQRTELAIYIKSIIRDGAKD